MSPPALVKELGVRYFKESGQKEMFQRVKIMLVSDRK